MSFFIGGKREVLIIFSKARGPGQTSHLPYPSTVPDVTIQWFTDLSIINIKWDVANIIKTESVLDKYLQNKTRKMGLNKTLYSY